MNLDEQLVHEVVEGARLVRASRRKALAQELRDHIQDIRDEARAEGIDANKLDDEIRTRFGPPSKIGKQLARVYRAERARYFIIAGSASALFLTAAAATFVYCFQLWLAYRMGYASTLSKKHFSQELVIMAFAIGCYIALRFIRSETKEAKIWADVVGGSLIFSGIVGVSLSALDPARSAALGCVFAVVLDRLSEDEVTNAWRVLFAVLASVFVALLPWALSTACGPRGMLFMIPTWFAIALAVCFSAFAARVVDDRIVSKRFAN